MRMPRCAPRPVPTSSAVGVASPRAHGHAMISTATAAVNAACAPAPLSSQTASVPSARTSTTGTNTAEMRSASRCTGALPVWAVATSRPICASRVSAPTRVARTTSAPEVLMVAPVTSSPGPTSTGTGSPVSSEVSSADVPLTTTPSVATFSPGRTTNSSPTVQAVDGDAPLGAADQQRHVLGAQVEQRAQGVAGASAGPVLGVPAGQQERGDDGGDLEVQLGDSMPISAPRPQRRASWSARARPHRRTAAPTATSRSRR